MNNDDKNLIYDALLFFVWAAGEGIAPTEKHIPEPEEALFDYFTKTELNKSEDDWDIVPELILLKLTT